MQSESLPYLLPPLTYRETGQFLRVSQGTVRNLVRAGKIKPARINRRVLFPVAVLQAFLSEAQTVPTRKRAPKRELARCAAGK